MDHLGLAAHVSFGLPGGRPVFLDLTRDRYLALDPEAERAFLSLLRDGTPACLSGEDIERLLRTELFERCAAPGTLAPAEVTIPLRELSASPVRHSLADLLEVWLRTWRARRSLKALPLRRVVMQLRALAGARPPGTAADLSARFRHARALVPVRPSCLQDTIALAHWLARRSASATIVFGVRLDPFGAHCWAQTSDLILNDSPDRVSQFTPVLVLP